MSYVCELGSDHFIFLDNQGSQTIITTLMRGHGQQQQSSNSVSTGSWTTVPKVYQTLHGVILEITAAQGKCFMQVQGSSMSAMPTPPSLNNVPQLPIRESKDKPVDASLPSMPSMQPMEPMQPIEPIQPIQPIQPMQPMQPMKMGNMEMTMNPMEMRMGNMHLSMGAATAPSKAASSHVRRFCSQCGSAVAPEDRFCSSCGTSLSR